VHVGRLVKDGSARLEERGGEEGRREGERDTKSIGRFIRFIADDVSNLLCGG